jgi:Concanavalin A-like lectin/glucanases superfamily/PKD domain
MSGQLRGTNGVISRCAALAAAVLVGVAVLPIPVGRASAAPTWPAERPATVTADALPTVQVAGLPQHDGPVTGADSGVVWKVAVVGSTVYAVGSFATARPAGVAAGVGDVREVPRQHALAFSLTTGELLPWAPALNGQALVVTASPDGGTLYVGGDFTEVDGQPRAHLAAFDLTQGGALVSGFQPTVGAQVRALAVTATTVYAGGVFSTAGPAGSAVRQRLAAFSRTDGTLLDWAPSADNQVEALVATPDGSRVVVGGRFQTLDGEPKVGIGAVDGTTGALAPWSSTPISPAVGVNKGWVTSLAVQGDTVFASADGEGGHWFDGRFAADLATGDLRWLDNCYGATYGIHPQGDVVYSVSHAHDCTSLGAWGETLPKTFHRALAETSFAVGPDHGNPSVGSVYSGQPVPALLPWLPDVNYGRYTGQSQGAWAVDGDAQYVVLGGEFTTVNNKPQQGLVRFATRPTAPATRGPVFRPDLGPSAVSTSPGTVKVSWPATYDPDGEALTYELFRDDGTPVTSVTASPTGWTPDYVSVPTGPALSYVDTAVPDGPHRYRLRISDADGNALDNLRSAPVTAVTVAPTGYVADVLADGAQSYWRLGEPGPTAADWAGSNDAFKDTGVTAAGTGAVGDDDLGADLDGTPAATVSTKTSMPAPSSFSVEVWLRTTSTTGGRVVGFSSAAGGSEAVSSGHDRHLYLTPDGRATFGVADAGFRTISSGPGLNDGAFHHLVGAYDSKTGMTLFVDGSTVGRLGAAGRPSPYPGYWRLGSERLAGWPGAPAAGSLAGTVDDVAVYPAPLDHAAVLRHWVDSGRTAPAAGTLPAAQLAVSCSWLLCTADGTASYAPDGTVQEYQVDFGDGTPVVVSATPLVAHVYQTAGTRGVRLTVVDDSGRVSPTSAAVSAVSAGTAGPRPAHRSGMLDRLRTGQ